MTLSPPSLRRTACREPPSETFEAARRGGGAVSGRRRRSRPGPRRRDVVSGTESTRPAARKRSRVLSRSAADPDSDDVGRRAWARDVDGGRGLAPRGSGTTHRDRGSLSAELIPGRSSFWLRDGVRLGGRAGVSRPV